MIDPGRLQVLRSIEQHGSVTEVARLMHLTPSAVSQQVRALATEVGTPLLERHGRTICLTPAARTLLGYAHQSAALWEATRAALDNAGSHLAGNLTVCSFATAIPSLVAPAAATLNRDNPDVTVTVREASAADGLSRLLHRSADIAVIPAPNNPRMDDPRFEQHHLLDDAQDLVVATESSLAQQASATLSELHRQVWIEPHHDQRDLIHAACALAGFAPQFQHHADDWNAALGLVAADLGICLYPRLAPLTNLGVTRIPLTGPQAPVRHIQACVHAGSSEQPLIHEALRQLRLGQLSLTP